MVSCGGRDHLIGSSGAVVRAVRLFVFRESIELPQQGVTPVLQVRRKSALGFGSIPGSLPPSTDSRALRDTASRTCFATPKAPPWAR